MTERQGEKMKRSMRGNLMLLTAAMVWGMSFVSQSVGMRYVQPFTFNGVRFLLGGLALLPVIRLLDRASGRSQLPAGELSAIRKSSVRAGVFCGLVLFAASTLQQQGILTSTAGKAGFITTLYIVIVPLLRSLGGKRLPLRIWLCVLSAVVGFLLLCAGESFSVSRGELLLLCCAVMYSVHILVIDRCNVGQVDGVRLSATQFLVSGVLSLVGMVLFDAPTWAGIWSARWTILYNGLLSCGVGYTLQVLGQRDTNPTVASLLMSLESVFAVLAGWAILRELLTGRELTGCALVFLAVIVSQLPEKKHKATLSR